MTRRARSPIAAPQRGRVGTSLRSPAPPLTNDVAWPYAPPPPLP